tara:strand:+ start:122 stop:544 length:423 start_codon:yes stop_codon:yes gene_type:complete
MQEEFYAIIKLISGEEIFALVSVDENDGNPVIVMQSPVTMRSFNHHGTSLLKIKPWVELSTDDIFVITYDKVLTMTETHDERIIEVYNRYLSDDDSDDFTDGSSRVNISSKMGYLTSVEDARKNLEDLYKIQVDDSDLSR